jgi:mycothiol system anti-sigma-R factor
LSLIDCGPDCLKALAEIERFLDGEVEPGMHAYIEHHLSGCTSCTERTEFRRRVRVMIAAKCSQEPVPAELRARIEGLIRGPLAP